MNDQSALDRFARKMGAKLARKNREGKTGWQMCSQARLSRMLREHVEKGDPVDVANFCMMLDALGLKIGKP